MYPLTGSVRGQSACEEQKAWFAFLSSSTAPSDSLMSPCWVFQRDHASKKEGKPTVGGGRLLRSLFQVISAIFLLTLLDDRACVLISRGCCHSFKDFSLLPDYERKSLFVFPAGAGLHEVS